MDQPIVQQILSYSIGKEFTIVNRPNQRMIVVANSSPNFFSWSKSDDHFAFGLSEQHPIGVDLCYVDDSFHFQSVIDQFFTQDEAEKVLNTPEKSKSSEFFKIWTRKEAAMKLVGKGIGIHLNAVDVLGSSFEMINHQSQERDRAFLLEIPVASKLAVAVATKEKLRIIGHQDLTLDSNPTIKAKAGFASPDSYRS